MGIPVLKIRRSWDRLFFNTGIPMLVRRHLYIDTAPVDTLQNPQFLLYAYEENHKTAIMHRTGYEAN